MPNWYKKQMPKSISKSRYSFSIEGDIFVDEDENKEFERYNAEEHLIGKLPTGEGIRVNDYNISVYKTI